MDPAQQGCGAGRAGLLAGQLVVIAGGEAGEPGGHHRVVRIAAQTARQAASRRPGRPRPEIVVLP
jgi:hypothetical protein